MARILVTDAGRGSAIAVIRSLGRRGHAVVAADADPRSPGFRSRYVSGTLVYPAPEASPLEAVSVLLEGARCERIDLIVPVTDEIILPLSEQRDQFRDVAALAMPEAEALARAADKIETYELGLRLGVPVPRGEVVSSPDEALVAAKALGWPVVLKPRVSRLFRDGAVEKLGVRYAGGPDEVEAHAVELTAKGRVLVQEWLPGQGHGVELLVDRGETVAAFQHRRLHEVPITGGASSLRESVPLARDLLAHAACLLAELRWTGLAMVEFRVGESGATLMEVNGRIWGSLPLAVKSGVDFPALLVELLLDGKVSSVPLPHTTYRVGVRSRNLELEVAWIAGVLRARSRAGVPIPSRWRGVVAAGKLALPGDGHDILSLEDPWPGLAELRKVGRKVRSKATRAG